LVSRQTAPPIIDERVRNLKVATHPHEGGYGLDALTLYPIPDTVPPISSHRGKRVKVICGRGKSDEKGGSMRMR
jgi:hypothetical protein